jgi:hypothetical protein
MEKPGTESCVKRGEPHLEFFAVLIKLAGHVARMRRGEVCTGFRWGNLRERDQWRDPDVDGRIISRWIFRKW